MAAPEVSVLLLTHNGVATLPRVLASIQAQVVPFPFEVVAVDSGSADGTLELLRHGADRLIEIREAEFNHGTTRNMGVGACRGPLVVLLVQDAEPASAQWLARLVEPLMAATPAKGGSPPGRPLAGTYGRQVPRADASAVARAYLSRYMPEGLETRVRTIGGRAAFDALSPPERLAACTFDNVCSCIRRDIWEQHPFEASPIAEDLAWARDVMLAGYGLAYVPSAAVVHSHDRPAAYELRRTYLVHQQLRRLFGLATIPTAMHLARGVVVSAAAHARWTLGGPGSAGARLCQLPRALALAVALPLGQFLGARSADSGREFLRVRGV
jgi:rhamnosyltransferase